MPLLLLHLSLLPMVLALLLRPVLLLQLHCRGCCRCCAAAAAVALARVAVPAVVAAAAATAAVAADAAVPLLPLLLLRACCCRCWCCWLLLPPLLRLLLMRCRHKSAISDSQELRLKFPVPWRPKPNQRQAHRLLQQRQALLPLLPLLLLQRKEAHRPRHALLQKLRQLLGMVNYPRTPHRRMLCSRCDT